jgi:hypothetical protein
VRDVLVEAVGLEGVADEREVRAELARDGGVILRPSAADREAGRHALLRV